MDVTIELFSPRSPDDFSKNVLHQIRIASTQYYKNFQTSLTGHLNIQLDHALIEKIDGSDCPYICSSNGFNLIENHTKEAMKYEALGDFEEYALSVWSLCSALWGYQEELEDQDPLSHFTVMFRRGLLSDWLENILTSKEVLAKTVEKSSYLDYIVDLLMCHKVSDATDLAMKYDDELLALALSEVSGGGETKELVGFQLSKWNSLEMDGFIKIDRLKLLMFVCGAPLMPSAHGPLHLFENYSWLTVLAVRLIYIIATDILFVF